MDTPETTFTDTAAPTFTDDTDAILWCNEQRITIDIDMLGEGTEPFVVSLTWYPLNADGSRNNEYGLGATFRTGRIWDAVTKFAWVRQRYVAVNPR